MNLLFAPFNRINITSSFKKDAKLIDGYITDLRGYARSKTGNSIKPDDVDELRRIPERNLIFLILAVAETKKLESLSQKKEDISNKTLIAQYNLEKNIDVKGNLNDSTAHEEEYVKLNLFTKHVTDSDICSMATIEVIKYDNRSYLKYAWDVLMRTYVIFYTFLSDSIIRPRSLMILLFFLSISTQFALNALLYTDDDIDQRNQDYYKSYNIVYNSINDSIPFHTL